MFFIVFTPLFANAENNVPLSRQQISLSYAPVVSLSAPAVVNIYTRKIVQTRVGGFGLFFPEFVSCLLAFGDYSGGFSVD